MKIVTSVTTFNDSVGLRISATYSIVDDETGRITEDNKRFDRVVTSDEAIAAARVLQTYATNSLPE